MLIRKAGQTPKASLSGERLMTIRYVIEFFDKNLPAGE